MEPIPKGVAGILRGTRDKMERDLRFDSGFFDLKYWYNGSRSEDYCRVSTCGREG